MRCLPGTKHGISGKFREVWSPENVDMVIIRENTEGLYSGIGERTAERATDLRVITRRASRARDPRGVRAVARSAARARPATASSASPASSSTTCSTAAGCSSRCSARSRSDYPDVEPDVAIVDSFAMFVLTQPERYDVCVTTNMFGDILTDLASVLQGGMGMAVGCNVGDDHAMFEPIHGSAPPLAGKDRANPMAMLLATGEALAWLGRRYADDRLLARAPRDRGRGRGDRRSAASRSPAISAAARRSRAVAAAVRDEVASARSERRWCRRSDSNRHSLAGRGF